MFPFVLPWISHVKKKGKKKASLQGAGAFHGLFKLRINNLYTNLLHIEGSSELTLSRTSPGFYVSSVQVF